MQRCGELLPLSSSLSLVKMVIKKKKKTTNLLYFSLHSLCHIVSYFSKSKKCPICGCRSENCMKCHLVMDLTYVECLQCVLITYWVFTGLRSKKNRAYNSLKIAYVMLALALVLICCSHIYIFISSGWKVFSEQPQSAVYLKNNYYKGIPLCPVQNNTILITYKTRRIIQHI